MQTEAFLIKNGGTSRRTENRRFLKKSIMLNRIRKNIQDNYTYCGIVHKPTAKQIAFLENKITAQVLEDKDEYRLYYRILKAEKAMLHREWDSISQYICGYADTGAIVLQIGKNIIPKPIQYKIAIGLYTDKGDMYCEILDIVKSGKEYRPKDWNKEIPECVRSETTFTVYRAGKESIDEAPQSMSWTLWRDVAEWFAERHEYYGQGTQHLYQATISADDIIAFTNGRQEFEIIQYQGVRDIEEVPRIGVSEEYKKLSVAPVHNFAEIDGNRNLAVELFSCWYRQNNTTR